MTIALLAHAIAQQSSGSSATTAGINTSGANLIVVAYEWFANNTPTLTDNKSNTWTLLTQSWCGGTCGVLQIAYCSNPTVGSGHTFTITASGDAFAICAAAFSGAKSSAPFDQQNHAITAGATSLQTGSVTPSEANELVIYGLGDAFTGTVSVNSGAIIDQLPLVPSIALALALAYEIQTTATTRNPTWTMANTRNQAAIATFKSAPGGGVPAGSNAQAVVSIM